MLTKAEVLSYKSEKLLSEVDRLRNLKSRDFLNDPLVLHDYLLVTEVHQNTKEFVKNLITQEFIDQQKLALEN